MFAFAAFGRSAFAVYRMTAKQFPFEQELNASILVAEFIQFENGLYFIEQRFRNYGRVNIRIVHAFECVFAYVFFCVQNIVNSVDCKRFAVVIDASIWQFLNYVFRYFTLGELLKYIKYDLCSVFINN